MRFLKFFFLSIFIYNSIQIYQYVSDKYSYQYEDWLINYSSGFVRRGLAGEILINISNLTQVNFQIIVFAFLICLLGIFYHRFYNLISKIELNFSILFLLFSPFFFTFYISNHGAGIRKEFLIFLFFCYLASQIDIKEKITKLWKFSAAFPILILVHEGLIFFLPIFFLFISFMATKKNLHSIKKQLIVTSFFSILIFFFSYLNKGTEEHILTICDGLKNYVKDNCLTGGAINHLRDELLPSIKHVINEHDFKSILQWIVITLYGYTPIFYILTRGKFKKNFVIKNKNFFILVLLINFICTLPLFVIAFDWGRWLAIYYHCTSLLIIFLIINKTLIIGNELTNKINYKLIILLILFSTFVTPSVFDKKSLDTENVYNFNYVKILKKKF